MLTRDCRKTANTANTKSLMRKHAQRAANGHYASELPLVLFVLFFFFILPMIDLGTIALRYGLLVAACREGAQTASKAFTFEVGTTQRPAAMTAGPASIQGFASRFGGINVVSTDADILITELSSKNVTRSEGKLSQPANIQLYNYLIETSVTATIDPIVAFNVPFLAAIPGLTGPVTFTVVGREFAENPQGLNI